MVDFPTSISSFGDLNLFIKAKVNVSQSASRFSRHQGWNHSMLHLPSSWMPIAPYQLNEFSPSGKTILLLRSTQTGLYPQILASIHSQNCTTIPSQTLVRNRCCFVLFGCTVILFCLGRTIVLFTLKKVLTWIVILERNLGKNIGWDYRGNSDICLVVNIDEKNRNSVVVSEK